MRAARAPSRCPRTSPRWERRVSFYLCRNVCKAPVKQPVRVVVVGRCLAVLLIGVTPACKRPLSVPPVKLAVIQFGGECDFVPAVLRDLHTEMNRVRRAGGNQVRVHGGMGGPRIAFVDPVSVLIERK